jgi:transposase InsO family protein
LISRIGFTVKRWSFPGIILPNTFVRAPRILQSDNGREFTANIITELRSLWQELVFVHSRPNHPQSQDSVERANADIKEMIISWMNDNDTTQWSEGLRFVQFQKNRSHHRVIDQPPYKALFGADPKNWLVFFFYTQGITSSARD